MDKEHIKLLANVIMNQLRCFEINNNFSSNFSLLKSIKSQIELIERKHFLDHWLDLSRIINNTKHHR